MSLWNLFLRIQEPGGVFPELPGMVEGDPNLQDIEGFSIFRGLKSDDSAATSVREDSVEHGGETGDMLHSSQESLLINDDSISSMDIDIGALEKVSFVSIVELLLNLFCNVAYSSRFLTVQKAVR